MIIEYVPLEYVHLVWPQVEQHIARNVPYAHGEFTVEQARALTSAGIWKLVVASEGTEVRGAMLLRVFNRPNQSVAYIQAVGGRGILSMDSFTQLCALAKSWGATQLDCACRPAMQRLLERVGMVEKYRVLGVAL